MKFWRLLCLLGIHKNSVVIDEPRVENSEVFFGVRIGCSRCPRVLHQVNWRMSFHGTGTHSPTLFDASRATEIDCN